MSETVALSDGLPPSIRHGEILGGKYRLEQEIGRGAMGRVWSAVHLTLGQRVAIKLILAEHAQAPEARQRFSMEAKAAARLRSRYVVQVYDDGETAAGTPYIVLEYLQGETLEQRIVREGPLPLNDAVRVTRHVARALLRAHAEGIVHRDLKPANVFLTRSDDDDLGWIAKVLDFGIAKSDEHGLGFGTKTGAVLGTPLFMSPEQARGERSLDARTDLYAVGMVFFNMVTGRYAFGGASLADVLVAICTAPLPDLRELSPWLPASVADWFQHACARRAQDRFQSADDLLSALDLALGVSTGAKSSESSAQGLAQPLPQTLLGHAPPGLGEAVPTPPRQTEVRTRTPLATLGEDLVVPTTTNGWLLAGAVLLLLLAGTVVLLRRRVEPETAIAAPSAGPAFKVGAATPVAAPPPLALPMPSAVPVATRAPGPVTVPLPRPAPAAASSSAPRPVGSAARPSVGPRPTDGTRKPSTDMGF